MTWEQRRQIHFWHEDNPFVVKHLIEQMTGTLLHRDLNDTGRLTYLGTSAAGNCKHSLLLRFEAVIESRNLYSFHIESTAPRQWVSEESLRRDANRASDYWSSKLNIPQQEIAWADASPALLLQRQQECLAMEAESARLVEDPKPIAAIQQDILAALRAGKVFRTSHKEGGTTLSFRGSSFLREDYGEEPNRRTYPTDEAMLVCLRNFYDWESRRDIYPHRPPELDVWNYIRNQLRD